MVIPAEGAATRPDIQMARSLMTDEPARKPRSRRQALRALKPRLTFEQELVVAISREPVRRVTEAEAELRRDACEVAPEIRRAEVLTAAIEELARSAKAAGASTEVVASLGYLLQ